MSREIRTYTLSVVVEPVEVAWPASCPTLLDYGAATWGSTREEALEQIRAVVTMLVERMAEEKAHGRGEDAGPGRTCRSGANPHRAGGRYRQRPDGLEPRQGL